MMPNVNPSSFSSISRTLTTALATVGNTTNSSNYTNIDSDVCVPKGSDCFYSMRNAFDHCLKKPDSLQCIEHLGSALKNCFDVEMSGYCKDSMKKLVTEGCESQAQLEDLLLNGLKRDDDGCPNAKCLESVIEVALCPTVDESTNVTELREYITDYVQFQCDILGFLTAPSANTNETESPAKELKGSSEPAPYEQESETGTKVAEEKGKSSAAFVPGASSLATLGAAALGYTFV